MCLQGVFQTLIHLLITRPVGKRACDWPVDDVDDPIGCWQVFLEDSVQSAGVLHQDEPLHQQDRDKHCVYVHFCNFLNMELSPLFETGHSTQRI